MPPDPHSPQPVPTTPPRPEGGSPEVDLLEEMGKTILQSAEVLVESLAGRTPIGDGWQTIRDLEHRGDAVARDMFEMLMTPRPTLIAPDALKALTGYLDDILDAIEAAAARLAIHGVRRAIPAARELGQIVLESAQELRQALELRQTGELRLRCFRTQPGGGKYASNASTADGPGPGHHAAWGRVEHCARPVPGHPQWRRGHIPVSPLLEVVSSLCGGDGCPDQLPVDRLRWRHPSVHRQDRGLRRQRRADDG